MRLLLISITGLCLFTASSFGEGNSLPRAGSKNGYQKNLSQQQPQAESKDAKRRRHIWSVADRSDEPAFQWIKTLFTDEKESVEYRSIAATVLAQMPHPHAPLVLTLGIRTAWPLTLREHIVKAIGVNRMMEGLPALAGLIDEGPKNNPLFSPAIKALGLFSHQDGLSTEIPPEVTKGLIRAYDQVEDPEIRVTIIEALSRLRMPDTAPFLFRIIQDGTQDARFRSMDIRARAVRALGRIVDADGVLKCAELLKTEKSRQVRDGLIYLIGHANGLEPMQALLVLLKDFRPDRPEQVADVSAVLAAIGDHVVENVGFFAKEMGDALIGIFQRDPGLVRFDAGAHRVILWLPESERLHVVAVLLASESEDVRRHVFRLAVKCSSPEVLAGLIRMLDKEIHPTVQGQIVEVIGDLYGVGGADAVPALKRAAAKGNEQVQTLVKAALAKWGVTADEELFQVTPKR